MAAATIAAIVDIEKLTHWEKRVHPELSAAIRELLHTAAVLHDSRIFDIEGAK